MNKRNKNTIPFLTEDGDTVEFSILEQTTVNGCSYLLVEEGSEEAGGEEQTVYIMRANPDASDNEMNEYVFVEDETELLLVSRIFEQLLDGTDIVME